MHAAALHTTGLRRQHPSPTLAPAQKAVPSPLTGGKQSSQPHSCHLNQGWAPSLCRPHSPAPADGAGMVPGEEPRWGRGNLSGWEVFPDWCPHCQGSSHSFQPDVLGRGAGHSLEPCEGCFNSRGFVRRGRQLLGRAGAAPAAPSSRGAGSAGLAPSTHQLNKRPPRAPHAWEAQPQPLRLLQPRVPERLRQPCIEKPLSAGSIRARREDAQGAGSSQARTRPCPRTPSSGQPGQASPHAWHHTGTTQTRSLPDNRLASSGMGMLF